MRKAKATYHAPEGDNKVVEMGGVTFYDGQEVELNSEDHPHLMSKIEGNHHFDVEMGEETTDEKPRRGRPRRDLKAGIEEARDHDFEADRRDGMSGRNPSEPAPDKASAE